MKAYIHIDSEYATWSNGIWAECEIPAVPHVDEMMWLPDEVYEELRKKIVDRFCEDYKKDRSFNGEDYRELLTDEAQALVQIEMYSLITPEMYKKCLFGLYDHYYVSAVLYNCHDNENSPFGVHIFLKDHV